jgi:hypothetical protein
LGLDGEAVDPLVPDGRVKILLFVRTDCPISNRYAPTYQALAKKLEGQPVDLWRVYVDPDETPELIRSHQKEYDLPGRVLRDPSQSLISELGIKVTPEVSVHDGEAKQRYRGRIDDWYAGYGKPRAKATTQELDDAVAALLRGEEPPVREVEAVGCPIPILDKESPTDDEKAVEAPPLPGADGVVPESPTYTEHVAPIILGRCASCHRPGQVAPFSLLEEGEVRDHAEQIADVTATRYMPPWKPVRGHGEFAADKSLTDAQIEILRLWVEQGAPKGPESARPSPPVFPEGWQRGTPDIILELPEPYVVPAAGLDIYRNFVLPVDISEPKWISGWELDPGNYRVVHHSILSLDSGNWAVEQDEAQEGPGFEAMELQGVQSPGGSYLVWTPGLIAEDTGSANAWRLRPGQRLVLSLHVQPTGKPEAVSPRVGLFFGERPTRTGLTLRVGDVPIDIPPGVADYSIADSLTLAAEVELLSIFPHAHYLARTFESKATLPDGSTRELLRIDDWDFSWQDQYRYQTPVRLPGGTVITMRITYDNSANNPRNPNQPPKRVLLGPNSEDEMGNLTFEAVPFDGKGLLALRETKYRRAIDRGAGSRQRYNLANVLRDKGDMQGAIAAYQKVLAAQPEHVWSLHNLSMVLQRVGRHEEAVRMARREVAAAPDSAGAQNNLGNALKGINQRGQAIEAFQAALELDPAFELARNNLLVLGIQP